MNPESFNGEEIIIGGRRFERIVAEPISCEWDGEQYIEKIKSNRSESAKLINEWIESHIMPLAEWKLFSFAQQKEKIFQWIEQHQPDDWDPKDPPVRTMHFGSEEFLNPYPNNLHEAVASALELDDYGELELFTALDTPADTLYGTDLFFKYQGVRLLLDATENKDKAKNIEFKDKADYIISWEQYDENGKRRQPTEFELAEEGRRIAKYLKLKIESQEISRKNLAA